MESINVEKIMQEIREDIKNKGYTSDMLSFKDIQTRDMIFDQYNENTYAAILHDLGVLAYVPWYRDLSQNAIKRIVQKTIRKFCSFFVAPIADQQSDFNQRTAKGFGQIAGYMEQSGNQLEACKKTIELLEEKIEKLETEVKKLSEKKG